MTLTFVSYLLIIFSLRLLILEIILILFKAIWCGLVYPFFRTLSQYNFFQRLWRMILLGIVIIPISTADISLSWIHSVLPYWSIILIFSLMWTVNSSFITTCFVEWILCSWFFFSIISLLTYYRILFFEWSLSDFVTRLICMFLENCL